MRVLKLNFVNADRVNAVYAIEQRLAEASLSPTEFRDPAVFNNMVDVNEVSYVIPATS